MATYTPEEFRRAQKRVERSNAAHSRLREKHLKLWHNTGATKHLVKAEYHRDIRAKQDTRILSKQEKRRVYLEAKDWILNHQ